MLDDPIIAPSALKHGLSEETSGIRPAARYASGSSARDSMLIVGPNQAAIFLEVGSVGGEQAHVIVHAMRAPEQCSR